MLVQFSVENFLSFDEEQVFSMVAAGGDQHPTHLVPDVPRKGESLLRAAALYGANGAGKSNLVQAILFAKNLIVEGTRGTQAIPVRPFKLGNGASRPSKFEFIIKTQGVLYNYGFRLDARRIHEEWLYATPNKQEVKFFERTTSEDGKAEVEVGPSLSGRNSRQRQFLQFVAQGTRRNQLFFTQAIENNVVELMSIFEWFEQALLVTTAEEQDFNLEARAHISQEFIAFLASFLRVADTGIEDITTRKQPFDFNQHVPRWSELQRYALRVELRQMEPNNLIRIDGDNGTPLLLTPGPNGEPLLVSLIPLHRAAGGRTVPFEVWEESEGTQRLLDLLSFVFGLKKGPEQVLVLDELDRRLHPLLSRLLIQTILAEGGEEQRSQIIFTTHDTNLLDLDLLRRDEIWFAEKDRGGASHLYSLAEFKTRPDLKIEKGYLSGRFGAIPFIGDIHRLDETIQETQKAGEPELSGVAA